MIVGGYTLDLYCDDQEHAGYTLDSGRTMVQTASGETSYLQDRFAGRTKAITYANAKAYGWKFLNAHEVRCPFCVARRKGA